MEAQQPIYFYRSHWEGPNEICVIKAPVKFINLYHSYGNAAMMVLTSVIVSFLLIFTTMQIRLFDLQIRLFEYLTV